MRHVLSLAFCFVGSQLGCSAEGGRGGDDSSAAAARGIASGGGASSSFSDEPDGLSSSGVGGTSSASLGEGGGAAVPTPSTYAPYDPSIAFEEPFGGRMLGATFYGANDIEFAIFAPNASSAEVRGNGWSVPLLGNENGVWSARATIQNADGQSYTFVLDGGEVGDPYARGTHGHRGDNFLSDPIFVWSDGAFDRPEKNELIIYELNLSDFTSHSSSGVPDGLKATYPGFLERLDHIKRLGVNAIELMPISEHQSDGYSWGYNPAFHFAPESSLAFEAGAQVNEFKTLVDTLHREGFAVLIDVVYNHMSGQTQDNPLYAVDAEYYFDNDGDEDLDDDATPWGYRFDAKKPFGKKFVYDNLKFWMDEFHVDGFRVDSTENMDGAATREIMRALYEDGYSDHLFFFEEFEWEHNEAIRALNLEFGEAFISSWGTGYKNKIWGLFAHGWCHCSSLDEPSNHSFSDGWDNPLEVTHYHASHDEGTLSARFDGSPEMVRVAATQLLTSAGIPMLWSGEEFLREHYGNYHPWGSNIAEENNILDWSFAEANAAMIDFYAALVVLRRDRLAFRADSVRFFHQADQHTLAMEMRDPGGDSALVFLNYSDTERSFDGISVPVPGVWSVVVEGEQADPVGLRAQDLGAIESFSVPSRSALVLVGP